jgi:hypothetical protein
MKPYARKKKETEKVIGLPKRRSDDRLFIIEEKHKHHKSWSKLGAYRNEKARDDAFRRYFHNYKNHSLRYYREIELRKTNLK